MPAAIAIPLIAGAAAQGVGAVVQAHGAKKAADTQAAAADRAMDFQRQVYGDQMRMVQPYVQFGTQSLANLGRLSATPFSDQTNGYVSAARGGQTPQFQQGMVNPAQGMSLGQMGQPQMPQGGPMVTLRAPTGEMQQVPMQHAARLIAAGAQRVN